MLEIDYYSTHKDPLHSYGGYAPNFPPIRTSLTPGPPFPPSTTRRDYLPPILPTSQESTSCGNVFLGRSGFSANKALHNPTSLDVLRARREQAAGFYSLNSKIAADCTIPTSLQSESYERFNPNSLAYDTCGLKTNTWMHSPGSRDSGFTNCYSSINPVYWRQHEPLMDQLAKNEIRTNAASVSHVDYQPYDLVQYETSPIQGTILTRGKGTGFTTTRELKPCFLPEPCVYSHHTPSYTDPRFETSYTHDYKNRFTTCSASGLDLVSPGDYVPKATSNDESRDFSLGCGPPRTYLSETRESYLNHWPLEGQRTFGLAFPISTVSSSGFCHSTKKHGRPAISDCPEVDMYDTSPQRYNPWPRAMLGHHTLIDKNYRPNPIKTGIDYTVTTSLPTTGSNPTQFLY